MWALYVTEWTSFCIIEADLVWLLTRQDSMTSALQTTARIRGLLASRREEIIENQYSEIKKLESKYRKLYDGSPVMLRTINTDGIILDCNQAYVSSLGFSTANEVIGHSIFEHTPKDSIQSKRESFEEWRRTGSVRNKEVWLRRKDGSVFPGLINANNLYDDDGYLVGSNTVIADLTEINKAQKQLERANEEIKKAYEFKEDFIRIAAHELRTPIQPILSCAELAINGKMNQEEAWAIVIHEARRLKHLANNILDASRMESGNLSYDFKKARINEVITEVMNSANVSEAHQGRPDGCKAVTIEAKLSDELELLLDRSRMIEALSNIVNNAMKFTRDGQVTIETCIIAHKKLFEIKISDTGIGIASEILPRMFEKFVTKSSGIGSLKEHGTGLGLFITKSIIQAHGGDVFAFNNEHGSGATFIIRLPMIA